jgi:hypothetical protein
MHIMRERKAVDLQITLPDESRARGAGLGHSLTRVLPLVIVTNLCLE